VPYAPLCNVSSTAGTCVPAAACKSSAECIPRVLHSREVKGSWQHNQVTKASHRNRSRATCAALLLWAARRGQRSNACLAAWMAAHAPPFPSSTLLALPQNIHLLQALHGQRLLLNQLITGGLHLGGGGIVDGQALLGCGGGVDRRSKRWVWLARSVFGGNKAVVGVGVVGGRVRSWHWAMCFRRWAGRGACGERWQQPHTEPTSAPATQSFNSSIGKRLNTGFKQFDRTC
jgi:hypothetical protein